VHLLQEEIRSLQKGICGNISEDFDPQMEFQEIQKLFELYNHDIKGTELSYLYASCHYTKDFRVLQ
jgi:hypothetical protein